MRADLRVGVVFALAMTAPSAASAFCRTTTVPVPADFSPAGGSCFTQGEPLYHPSQCVTFKVATAARNVIGANVIADTFARAFATWTAPNDRCLPGISVVQVGTVEGPVQVGYTANAPGSNANVIGFVQGPWPHGEGNDTLALTTVTFRADDGRILDADTEINRDVSWSATRPIGPSEYDFGTAMLHEAGHFLGLAHSATPDSAMFASYTVGTSRTTLDDDDVAGICAIYPSRDARATRTGQVASTACQLAPDPGSNASSCGDPTLVHGCSIASPPRSATNDTTWWAAAAVTLGALAAARLRSRRLARK